jgi:hypothetical protein
MDRKDKCNHNHKSSHGNGFLLGVILGVIVTLLFTTKKGREIVKILTEKGLDKFSDLQKVMNEATSDVEEELIELVEEESEGDYVPQLGVDESEIMKQESREENESKEKEEKKEKLDHVKILAAKEKVEHKAVSEPKVASAHASSGEPREKGGASKRFFLRRVKKN